MNKGELIDVVADDAGLSKADATRAVDAVITAITKALKKGDQVALVGFGTFAVKERAAVSYTHLRAHETVLALVCRLLLEQKNNSLRITLTPHT